MQCSKEEALSVLEKCREEDRWIFSLVFIEPETSGVTEEHHFLAKVSKPITNDSPIALAGEYGLFEIPMEGDVVFEFSDSREAPERLRKKYAGFDFALSIKSKRVTAVLYAPKESD